MWLSDVRTFRFRRILSGKKSKLKIIYVKKWNEVKRTKTFCSFLNYVPTMLSFRYWTSRQLTAMTMNERKLKLFSQSNWIEFAGLFIHMRWTIMSIVRENHKIHIKLTQFINVIEHSLPLKGGLRGVDITQHSCWWI